MDLTQRILYRDAMMLVIDKPAGLPVHRGRPGGLALDDYFDKLRFGLRERPELAHRLDSDTSGCLVLGRHRRALARLGQLFQAGGIEKTYWALVTRADGVVGDSGEWQKMTGYVRKISSQAQGWTMKVCDPSDAGAKPAETWWRLRGKTQLQPQVEPHAEPPPAPALYWLELQPKTGRTHQLRLHCAAMGWPILGDVQYGGQNLSDFTAKYAKYAKYADFVTTRDQAWRGIGLVAKRMTIPLYANQPPITVTAPLPLALQPWFAACGWTPDKEA